MHNVTAFNNLRQFIEELEACGELKRIRRPVSARLEISRLTDQESKRPGGGKALYFEQVKHSSFPVVTNVFGSSRRICLALGVTHLDQLGDRIREFTEFDAPQSLKEAFRLIPKAVEVSRCLPRRFKSGTPPCQQVVHTGDDVDLTRIPVLKCWPKDGGPFVTLPLVITRSPVSGKRNMGMYRLQIFDRNTTGMHWHIHKDGSHYYQEYCRQNRKMPVAVAVGADPATVYSATAPLPRGMDEVMLAGFIRRKPVVMTRCVTVDLEVPAEAEFVLEGYVVPGELRREGPFGDHTGYYSLEDDYPVFHVTAVTHRRDAVYHATVVGPPPMEDCYLARATERLFLPMIQAVMPEIRDYWFPWEGVFHNIVVVSIDKEYPGHAWKVMSGLWGQGQMSFCKAIVVVDPAVDCQNPEKILDAFVRNFDVQTDITLTLGILDVLDHSSPNPTYGNKIGIDLTRRFPNEEPRIPVTVTAGTITDEPIPDALFESVPEISGVRVIRPEITTDEPVRNHMLAVSVQKSVDRGGRYVADMILNDAGLARFNLIVLFDDDIDLNDASMMLWKLFNNVDPGRDMVIRQGRAVVDACKKGAMDGHHREWPDDLTFD